VHFQRGEDLGLEQIGAAAVMGEGDQARRVLKSPCTAP
jgi:hypothetical protein